MPGEIFPTRPQEQQDPRRIAAGSPLAVVGIFLEVLRARFRADSGMPFVWHTDPSESGIQIEMGYNKHVEARDMQRALVVNRLATVPLQLVVGHNVGTHLPTAKRGYYTHFLVRMSIDCVSTDMGESMYLADVVQFLLLAAREPISAAYSFHEIGVPEMGQTAPFVLDADKFSTTVSFEVQIHARWTTMKIAPILAQVGIRVVDSDTGKDAAGHFVDVAMQSSERVWPLVPPYIATGTPAPDPGAFSPAENGGSTGVGLAAPGINGELLYGPPGPPGQEGADGNPGAPGKPGPIGPAGPAGGTLDRIAGPPISAQRVVRATGSTTIDYCDARQFSHVLTALGVSLNAAGTGGSVTVVTLGELTEPSWSWTPGLPIFCGDDGALTQTEDPAWAWTRIVAVAETSTRIYVSLRDPIVH